uniref:Flotillin n=1 Tax=Lynx canadensis TaxID=61383 RepID=A0A667HCW5_LYNCA
MTLQPRCEDVETAEGVALTVTGVAQVKIMTEKELLAVACEQFLGKNVQDIKNVVLQTLEGHLRSILGTLTVEQIYQDRDQFAKLVREVAAPDVGRMGIEILSFTIKDVYDKVDYLSSLGKTQTAVVQRDADIGVAEAERDAGIREAECKKEMLDVKFMADTKIADSKRAFELQKSAFSEEVNIKVRSHRASQVGAQGSGSGSQPLTCCPSSCRRQPRPSWPMSCKEPVSSRRSGRKRLRLRLYSARSRSQWRHRRSCAQIRSSLPQCAVLPRLRPTAYSRSPRVKSERPWLRGGLVRPLSHPPLQPQRGSRLSQHLLTEVGVCRLPSGIAVGKAELDKGDLRAQYGTWHSGHPGQSLASLSHLHLAAGGLSLPEPEEGTSLLRSPTPDTRQSRGLEGLLAPRQGLRGPWHFALMLPGLNSCRVKQVLLAQAEAEKIRKIGEAEAAVIEAMGKAEAERMKLKAEAYQKYGDAAKMALVLEALPQIAAKIAAPLTKVDEIVVLSGDNSKVTSEVNRLLAELPASVHALTGMDLSKIPLIKKATGAQA